MRAAGYARVPVGVADDPRLSLAARRAITDATERLVSLASCWKIAIKGSPGRLKLEQPLERFIPEQLEVNPFQLLPIDLDHIARLATMPFHYRDPFDRMLVAHALGEDLTIVSKDAIFEKYDLKRIW